MEDVGSIALVVSGSEGTGTKGAAISTPKREKAGKAGKGTCQRDSTKSTEIARSVKEQG